MNSLEVVVFVGQGRCLGRFELLRVLVHEGLVDLDFGRRERGRGDKVERAVSDELPREPEEGLLEVEVGFRRDLKVLEVLLSVEGDGARLDLALLDVDLVSAEDDGDVLAHTAEVTVPRGDVLVCETRRHVEHDYSTLTMDAAREIY